MTTQSAPWRSMHRRRHLRSTVVATAVVAVTGALTVAALMTADGVVPLGPDTYDHVEFIDVGLLALTWLSLVGLAVAAWWWAVPAAVGVFGVTAVTAGGVAVTVQRYEDSGVGDGLEYLAFALPVGLLVVGSAVVVAVVSVRRRHRMAASG